VLSLVAILPFAVFLTVLSTDPVSLGWRPFGGPISIAIYLAVFLFVWPIVVNAIYIARADRDQP
jgi:uncharacterized membrane protein (DUF485 family)